MAAGDGGAAGGLSEGFVGRAPLLAALDEELSAASAGATRLVLLSGGPGIGKTRFSEVAEERALARGFRVVRGRCSEVPGVPAYWCFRQLLRALQAETQLDPAALVGADSPALALMEWGDTGSSDGERDRFRLFSDVAAWLDGAAQQAPLLVVLDDLHAADIDSGRLAGFLANELRGSPLLLLATARDGELPSEHPLQGVLGELAQRGRPMPLGPLSRDEVAELAAAIVKREAAVALYDELHERSGGNPLFVRQLSELLAAEVPDLTVAAAAEHLRRLAPEGVRHVIERRLTRLSHAEREALTLAAVLGREFPLDLLESLGKASGLDGCAARVDALADGDLIRPLPGPSRELGFSHVLIRDVLYASCARPQRRRLHAAASEAIRSVRDLADDTWLAAAAHHALAAGEAEALDLADRAGRRALARHAHEEAAGWLDAALQLVEALPESRAREERRAALLEALATARWRAGDVAGARELYARAFAIARELGDASLFAAAALGWVGRTDMSLGPEPEAEMLLREALERLGPGPSRLRSELLTRLASALYFSPDAQAREAAAREAVACAESEGAPGGVAYALSAQHYGLTRPGQLARRRLVSRRLVAEAERSGEGPVRVLAHFAMVRDAMEAGDLALVDRHLAALGELAERLRQPFYRWQHAFLLAARSLFMGEFERGEELASRALEIGQGFAGPNALPVYAGQLYAARRAQGRLGELEPLLATLVEERPEVAAFAFARAEAQLALGRREQAQAFLRGIGPEAIDAFPDDFNWPSLVSVTARLCCELEDEERAAALLPLTHSAGGSCVVLALGTVWDAAYDLFSGRLATLLGRWEEADEALRRAEQIHARLATRAQLALTWLARARLCARRAAAGDRAEQQRLAREAGALFEELGMKRDAEAAAELADAGAAAPRAVPPVSAELWREGDEWRIAFAGRRARVPHSRGMAYLAALLERAGEPVHVLDLTALHGPRRRGGDLGEVLDARARAEIRERLAALEAEIETADANRDLARAAALREEREATERHLLTALGLGGRPRRAGDPVERARKSVYNRLHDAIARIEAELPELGRHLRHGVKTGRTCVYAPERPVGWRSTC